MKKYILPIVIIIMLASLSTSTALASSNLEISTSADFNFQTLNFSGGQTIFARIASTSVGSKKSQLNLRDNQYNLVNTFKLEREGAYYSAVLPAPYNSGYYSLEAQIESDASNTTSVKTIKVGNPNGADVSIHVNSSTGGQSKEVLGEKSDTGLQSKNTISSVSPSPSPSIATQPLIDDITYSNNHKGIFITIVNIFREVADFLWPFN